MHAKVHKTKDATVLACCDADLVGTKIKYGEIEIELKESFYNGSKIDEKQFIKLLKEADSINLFGKKCIAIALQKGFITEHNIIKIGNISHVQIYKF